MTYPPPGTPDPYGQQQQPSQDPFASPPPPAYDPTSQPATYDPYAQQPPAAPQSPAYAPQSPAYPPQSPAYGQQSPAAPQNPYDPYAQQPQQAQYSQPYGQQQYAYGTAPSGKTNGMSIASLATGITGLLLCICYGIGLIPGALGLVFGFIGLKQIKERGENGRGMAIAGAITGGIAILLSIGFWILVAIGISMDPDSLN
ncbi:MAG: DUF4190 domain-containing protein [Hamadaea sp.]|nr:DUF4190 domain-containing protein [Hamadaea sp.]